jgi:hypothetical protein
MSGPADAHGLKLDGKDTPLAKMILSDEAQHYIHKTQFFLITSLRGAVLTRV